MAEVYDVPLIKLNIQICNNVLAVVFFQGYRLPYLLRLKRKADLRFHMEVALNALIVLHDLLLMAPVVLILLLSVSIYKHSTI